MIRSSTICIAILTILLLSGCATPQKGDKDPFLDEWRELAEESRGHSPTPQEAEPQKPKTFTGIKDGKKPDQAQKLPQDKVSMKFRDNNLRVILRTLATAADQNIVMSNNVSGTMSIDLNETPWDQAFLSVIATNGLTYSWQGEIIKVQSQQDIQRNRKLQQMQKENQPLQTTVVDIDYAHIVDRGITIGGDESNLGIGNDGETKDLEQLETRLQKLLDNITGDGKKGELFVDRENNALVIQATEEDTQRILHVFKNLDRPRKQIHIEANVVETTQNNARRLGMRYTGRYVRSSGNLDDVGLIGDANEPDDMGSVLDPLLDEDALGGLHLGAVAGEIAGNVLFAQLQALEEEGTLNILSSPSLTTMDNQKARTHHGEVVPYRTYSYEDGNRTPDDVEEIEAGLGLEVLPTVINDEYLRMHIQISKDEFNWNRQVDGLPAINTKRTETNTMVRSGDTIVIAGLTKQTLEDTEAGAPGLRNLPGLGWLFKGQEKKNDMEEFMLFITPTILDKPGS